MKRDPDREAYWQQQPWRECSDRELARRLPEHRRTICKWRKRVGEPWEGLRFTGPRTTVADEPPPGNPATPQLGQLLVTPVARTRCDHADEYKATRPPTCGCQACADKWAVASATRPQLARVDNQPSSDDSRADAFGLLSKFCKREPRTIDEVCDFLDCGPTKSQRVISAAQAAGHPLQLHGNRLTWHMPDEWAEDETVSQAIQPGQGWTQIAFVSDTHFGSKWERSDLLADFFREAYGRGCRLFFHSGDILDGEYTHSLRERYAHGFDEQADAVGEKLPSGDGADWHFVDGNHDETISKSGGAVSGRALVERLNSLGRNDVTFQGQRLGRVKIKHEGFDYMPTVELWHPKRGKAYADSYGLQKRIEEYQPGTKPDILAVGHWHAYVHLAKRGVHAMAVPCFQGGGSAFGNSLPGAPVLGGIILNYSLTEHGTLRRVSVELVQYFEREESRVISVAQAAV